MLYNYCVPYRDSLHLSYTELPWLNLLFENDNHESFWLTKPHYDSTRRAIIGTVEDAGRVKVLSQPFKVSLNNALYGLEQHHMIFNELNSYSWYVSTVADNTIVLTTYPQGL